MGLDTVLSVGECITINKPIDTSKPKPMSGSIVYNYSTNSLWVYSYDGWVDIRENAEDKPVYANCKGCGNAGIVGKTCTQCKQVLISDEPKEKTNTGYF